MSLVRGTQGYIVLVDKRVERDLEDVPRHVTRRFLKALDRFEKDPFRPRAGFDVRRLKGLPGNTFRLMIGDYRVLFSIDEERGQDNHNRASERSISLKGVAAAIWRLLAQSSRSRYAGCFWPVFSVTYLYRAKTTRR